MIYLLIIPVLIIAFAIEALLLHITTKIFKLNKASYKKAMIVSALQWLVILIIAIILGIILSILGLQNLNIFLAIIIGFSIFHKLLQKYYQTNLKKNISIYIVFTIFTVIIPLTIIIPVRTFFVEPFYVSDSAMAPAYEDGEYLLTDKFTKDYQRGDVVIFRSPDNPQENYIKRIIALPAEKVQIKEGAVYLYDEQNSDGYKLSETYLNQDTQTFTLNEDIIELANNEYYLLGDNRGSSKDSRSFGPILESDFIGEVWTSLK